MDYHVAPPSLFTDIEMLSYFRRYVMFLYAYHATYAGFHDRGLLDIFRLHLFYILFSLCHFGHLRRPFIVALLEYYC